MKVQMALDAPSEASAVAQGSILAQCCSELSKFPKVFGVQPQPVGVVGKECEEYNERSEGHGCSFGPTCFYITFCVLLDKASEGEVSTFTILFKNRFPTLIC